MCWRKDNMVKSQIICLDNGATTRYHTSTALTADTVSAIVHVFCLHNIHILWSLSTVFQLWNQIKELYTKSELLKMVLLRTWSLLTYDTVSLVSVGEHFKGCTAFINISYMACTRKLPYFSVDNAHIMYNAHPKLFRQSFWLNLIYLSYISNVYRAFLFFLRI
jgi:hypothetical protein